MNKSIPGIILIISCHKHLNTRVKEFKLQNTEYAGWKVVTIIGNPLLTSEYELNESTNILTIQCEDSYIHLLKKVALSMKILLSMYNILEGILRCGDDIEFNEDNLINFLNNSDKQNYMGYNNPLANPNRNIIKKKIDNWMPNYYIEHPEELLIPLNGLTNMTVEQIKQINIAPTCLTNIGVIVYFSVKSCQILIDEMEKVSWNIFTEDMEYGYMYSIEDVGIATILHKNNIEPCFYQFYTETEINKQNYVGYHTNKYK